MGSFAISINRRVLKSWLSLRQMASERIWNLLDPGQDGLW